MPTIAALKGLAFGGGLEMTLACDFRIAAHGSRFALPEVGHRDRAMRRRYATPATPGRADQGQGTDPDGQKIGVEAALDKGLLSEIGPSGSLTEEARGLAAEIAVNSPLALAYAKAEVDLAPERSIGQGLRYETAAIRTTLASEDYGIGLAEFARKEAP